MPGTVVGRHDPPAPVQVETPIRGLSSRAVTVVFPRLGADQRLPECGRNCRIWGNSAVTHRDPRRAIRVDGVAEGPGDVGAVRPGETHVQAVLLAGLDRAGCCWTPEGPGVGPVDSDGGGGDAGRAGGRRREAAQSWRSKAHALWVGTAIDGVDGPAGRLQATAAAVNRFRTGCVRTLVVHLIGRGSGAEALWGLETMANLAHGVAAGNRLDAEVGYGLPVASRVTASACWRARA